MSVQNAQSRTAAPYRERLGPSLWFLVSAALCGPMAALVFVPLDTTVALIVGALVGVGVVALLVSGSPVISVTGGELRAGRAHIPVEFLDAGSWVSGDDAQYARSAGLHPRAWHLIRGGIDAVVVFSVTDPDDPTPYWVISSRTPDRLVAAVRRAQS